MKTLFEWKVARNKKGLICHLLKCVPIIRPHYQFSGHCKRCGAKVAA